jgi:hypothetical protein
MRTAVKHLMLVAVAVMALAGLSVPAVSQLPCPCALPDNGAGTVTMPPNCIEGYLGWLTIDTGIVGGTIEIDATWVDFAGVAEIVGGGLGGTQSSFDGLMVMEMTGTGSLAGFSRTLFMPLLLSTIDWGPRVLGDPVQTFTGEPRKIMGDIFGDPDFDAISFRTGSDLGLPGTGPTTLTRLGPPGSDFQVDSFFDIAYEIEYVGAPGSVLGGFSGTVERQTRFQTCPEGASPVEDVTWGTIKALYR